MRLLRFLRRDATGATAIEYALIAAFISVAAVLAMQAIGSSVSSSLNNVTAKL